MATSAISGNVLFFRTKH